MSAPVSYYDMTLAIIRERVSASTISRRDIATGAGLTVRQLNAKLSGDATLTVQDIARLATVLGCRMSDLVA